MTLWIFGQILWPLELIYGTVPFVGGRQDSSSDIRRRARRTGQLALALLSATTAASLLLAHLYQNDTVTILTAVLGGLPGLYLAYAAYRDDRKAEAAAEARLSLTQLADQFADAVRSQWQEEASARRLNDPYPLPVRWVPAHPSLFDRWTTQARLAATGAGWPSATRRWASGPSGLAGEGSQLSVILARVPTGRLVVLGEPGSGKTILVMRLVLDLLARRTSGGPVPVLVSAASWDPTTQDLHGWLARQLTISYTALTPPAQSGAAGSSRIRALLGAGLILPILDGLDEIPDGIRGPAITRINDAMRPGERLVMTCRSAPFQDAVRPAQGPPVTVRGAAGVELCPLDANAVASYLLADVGVTEGETRWAPVVADLRMPTPLARTLSSPLMVGLARAIYNPRPGESAVTLPDPVELCTLPDTVAIEAHLLSAFIPAAYRSHAGQPGRRRDWSTAQAESWLTLLARHLEYTVHGPDLAWWELPRSTPRVVAGLATGLITGLVAGLATEIAFVVITAVLDASPLPFPTVPTVGMAAVTGLKYASIAGLAAGLLGGTAAAATAQGDQPVVRRTRWSPRSPAISRTAATVTAGLAAGLAGWLWFQHWLAIGLGIVAAILVAVSCKRADRLSKSLDFQAGSAAGIVVGSVVGLTFGIVTGVLLGGSSVGLRWGLGWGLMTGLAAATGTMLNGGHGERPARGVRWNARKGSLAAVMAGAAAALIGTLGGGSAFGLSFGLIFGLTCGIAFGAVAGLERIPSEITTGTGPRPSWRVIAAPRCC